MSIRDADVRGKLSTPEFNLQQLMCRSAVLVKLASCVDRKIESSGTACENGFKANKHKLHSEVVGGGMRLLTEPADHLETILI